MSDHFEAILDECVSALQAGVPIEDVLAEVPEYAAELRPMLHLATVLADPDPVLVPAEQKAALRNKYLQEVATLPAVPKPSGNEKVQAIYHVLKRRLTPQAVLSDLLTVLITALLTIVLSLLLLRYAAIDTIPGDPLYSLKRIEENTRLWLTPDDSTDQQRLEQTFNQRRLDEVERMTELSRIGLVNFVGVLESRGQNLWVVESYPVIITEDSTIQGNPQIGDRIEVVGFLRSNRNLLAETIRVVE